MTDRPELILTDLIDAYGPAVGLAIILDTARIVRRERIAANDPITNESGMHGPVHEVYAAELRAMFKRHNVHEKYLREILHSMPLERMREIAAKVEAELPDPWSGPPPAGFCTACTRGWDPQNPPDGVAWNRPRDPEDGPGQWEWRRQVVLCAECEKEHGCPECWFVECQCDQIAWGEASEAAAMNDDPDYERYCLEYELVGWAFEEFDHLGEVKRASGGAR